MFIYSLTHHSTTLDCNSSAKITISSFGFHKNVLSCAIIHGLQAYDSSLWWESYLIWTERWGRCLKTVAKTVNCCNSCSKTVDRFLQLLHQFNSSTVTGTLRQFCDVNCSVIRYLNTFVVFNVNVVFFSFIWLMLIKSMLKI